MVLAGAAAAVETPVLSVLEPYDKTQTITLKETDSLKIPLAKVFTAEQGAEVTIATSLASNVLTRIKPAGAPTLSDTLVYISNNLDKDSSLSLTIIALSGTESVMVQFNLTITDEGEGPVGPTCPGDPECPDDPPTENRPPVVLAPYDVDVFALDTMQETDTLKIPLGDLFADEDDNNLIFVVGMSAKVMKVITAIDKVALWDTLKIVPSEVEKDTSFIVTVYATDGMSDLVHVNFGVTIEASKTPPVPPVNSKPTMTIADSAFLRDTLALDVDFDEDTVEQVKISTKSLVFADSEVAEGTQRFTYKAVGTKINASVDSVNAKSYFISLKPVKGATGLANIFFFASDGEDSVGVKLYVKLIPPKDTVQVAKDTTQAKKDTAQVAKDTVQTVKGVAQAVKDKYSTFSDSALTVSAKKGVLANDAYPDGVSKGMTAEIAQKPAHGTLTLNKDGSFTYKPKKGFVGTDSFDYYAVVDGTKSKSATVTIEVNKRKSNSTTAQKPQLATLKNTWQNAVMASRGTVALFDMNGRVMWQAKLPVSEADVRNAAAQVQGRKILRVNRQTWTIR